MQKSTKRRVLGVLGVVLATQALSACVVVPVPARHRTVVVEPGYGPPPPHYDRRDRRDRDWDRGWRR